MTDTLDLTKWARLSEDTKKALAPLVADFGLSASLAPALEAIKLVRERFLTSIPVYPLPEIFSKPAVFSLIEYRCFLPFLTSPRSSNRRFWRRLRSCPMRTTILRQS